MSKIRALIAQRAEGFAQANLTLRGWGNLTWRDLLHAKNLEVDVDLKVGRSFRERFVIPLEDSSYEFLEYDDGTKPTSFERSLYLRKPRCFRLKRDPVEVSLVLTGKASAFCLREKQPSFWARACTGEAMPLHTSIDLISTNQGSGLTPRSLVGLHTRDWVLRNAYISYPNEESAIFAEMSREKAEEEQPGSYRWDHALVHARQMDRQYHGSISLIGGGPWSHALGKDIEIVRPSFDKKLHELYPLVKAAGSISAQDVIAGVRKQTQRYGFWRGISYIWENC